jgi:hypothetical protein
VAVEVGVGAGVSVAVAVGAAVAVEVGVGTGVCVWVAVRDGAAVGVEARGRVDVDARESVAVERATGCPASSCAALRHPSLPPEAIKAAIAMLAPRTIAKQTMSATGSLLLPACPA